MMENIGGHGGTGGGGMFKGRFAQHRERNLPRSTQFLEITGIRVPSLSAGFFKCDFWIPGKILHRHR